ncbi:MAG TPA: hypothetical protein PKD55_03860 [Bellilinea sp.]|nr:hypothetical protein [Bellilinea sp.]
MFLVFAFPLLFILAFVIVNLLRLAPKGVGYAWLSAVALAVISWLGVIIVRWRIPVSKFIEPWRPFAETQADPILFGCDAVSWPIGAALLAVFAGFLMTSGAREDLQATPFSWSSKFLITAISLTAILAQSPLALLFAWAIFDVAELMINLSLVDGWKFDDRHAKVFVGRSLGLFLLTAAIVLHREVGLPLTFESMGETASVLVILAFISRIFTVPMIFQHDEGLHHQSGLVNYLRLATLASILAPLCRVQLGLMPQNWSQAISIISVALLLVVSFRWIASKEENYARPFLDMALAILVILSVLKGKQNAAIAWSVAYLINGAVLLLYTAKGKSLRFIPVLGVIGLSGLPFTPAAAGWAGLMGTRLNVPQLLIILSMAMILAGYLKMGLRQGDQFNTLEGWIRGLYPFGLVFILSSHWIIALLGIKGAFSTEFWWAPATSLLFMGIAVIWRLAIQNPQQRSSILYTTYDRLSSWNVAMDSAFRISRIETLVNWILRQVESFVTFITRLFESSGGILWSLLALVTLLIVAGLGGR